MEALNQEQLRLKRNIPAKLDFLEVPADRKFYMLLKAKGKKISLC